eukprot:2529171-Amphidinium_carterae.1
MDQSAQSMLLSITLGVIPLIMLIGVRVPKGDVRDQSDHEEGNQSQHYEESESQKNESQNKENQK